MPKTENLEKMKRKAAKHKHKEKLKRKKKKSKHNRSSSESSSDQSKEEWVEKTIDKPEPSAPKEQSQPAEREEWMNLPSLFNCFSENHSKSKKKEKERDSSILDQPGQSSRELNPYWKNGGTGVPETENKARVKQTLDAAWLKKSLQRVKEQADQEGRTLAEVASERWGSLDTIKSMIAEAECKSRNNDRSFYAKRTHIKYHDDVNTKYVKCKYRSFNDDSSERRPRSRSKSKDRHEWSSEYNKHLESRKHNKLRSQSPELEERHQRKRYGSHSNHDKKKLSFKKPSDNEDIPCHSESNRSRSRKWQKPEFQETSYRKISEVHTQVKPIELNDESDLELETSKKKEDECVLTESEMNQLGAKIVKAEIMGDMELATKLKSQLEKAREHRKKADTKSCITEENAVLLIRTDASGTTRPIQPRNESTETSAKNRKKKNVNTHQSGQRIRYFPDDDKYSLEQLYEREKGSSAKDTEASFVKIASSSMNMEDLFGSEMISDRSEVAQEASDRAQAIREDQRISNCSWCINSKHMLKHMIVTMGSTIYLSLPPYTSLTSGHCILAPIQHVICQTHLDENVWEELQAFKMALTKMFESQNKSLIFFEVSMRWRDYPHMRLECVPLPKEIGDMAPMYFKKALLECEMEWSTNKKVIDLSQHDVRRAVPKALPYFSVNFGIQGGFAHIIEDDKLFPRNFAQEIIGGMLELDHNIWRKPRAEQFEQQRSKVMEFKKTWEKFDCTT
ncbi:CWF19-like protein 2 [Orussus abietinus]|uniref:CWF19-like protein 2 n=1 Tax=Orussus abietinus TaxID=222816 RepID=UPI00062615BC|nr:CWF19-like protein 2 [Orussus abietinus]